MERVVEPRDALLGPGERVVRKKRRVPVGRFRSAASARARTQGRPKCSGGPSRGQTRVRAARGRPTGGRADGTPNRGCRGDGRDRIGGTGVDEHQTRRTPPRGHAHRPFGVPRTRRRAGGRVGGRVIGVWRGSVAFTAARCGGRTARTGSVPDPGAEARRAGSRSRRAIGPVRERAGRRSSPPGGRPGPPGSVDPTERRRTSRPGRWSRSRGRGRSARRTGHPGLG